MTYPVTIDQDRIVPLSRVQNFREVGGYPTRDGGKMKRGLIWRSARLDELTSTDMDLEALRSIRLVADLRRETERRANPTPLGFTASRTVLTWNREQGEFARPEGLFAKGLNADGYAEGVRQFYRGLAEGHREELSALYRQLAAGEVPVLIHCSAGKDRTGIAVALLLELIGVDRNYVIADYCKTSELLDWQWLRSGAAAAGMQRGWLDQLAPQALEVLMRADASYLCAAFDAIELQYGSVRQFACEALDLSDAEIDALGHLFVDPLDKGEAR